MLYRLICLCLYLLMKAFYGCMRECDTFVWCTFLHFGSLRTSHFSNLSSVPNFLLLLFPIAMVHWHWRPVYLYYFKSTFITHAEFTYDERMNGVFINGLIKFIILVWRVSFNSFSLGLWVTCFPYVIYFPAMFPF